jgi:hypothetical protein
MNDYTALKSDGKILQLLGDVKADIQSTSSVLELLNAVKDFLPGLSVMDLFVYLTSVGKVYTVRKVISITAGSTDNEIWFSIDTFSKNTVVLFPPVFSAVNGGPLRCDIYFGAQRQAGTGTSIQGFNRNADYTSVSEAAVVFNPTVTQNGVLGPQYLVKSTDVTNQSAGAGDSTKIEFPFIYSPSLGILPSNARAVINHLGVDDAIFEYNFVWAEI